MEFLPHQYLCSLLRLLFTLIFLGVVKDSDPILLLVPRNLHIILYQFRSPTFPGASTQDPLIESLLCFYPSQSYFPAKQPPPMLSYFANASASAGNVDVHLPPAHNCSLHFLIPVVVVVAISGTVPARIIHCCNCSIALSHLSFAALSQHLSRYFDVSTCLNCGHPFIC